MWNAHTASAGKNQSTSRCISESATYVFSLAKLLNHDASVQLLPTTSKIILDTKAPLVLLVLGITATGVSLLGFLYGIFVMMRAIRVVDMPLVVLRIAFFASIAALITLTISSAKITANADRITGTTNIGTGQPVHVYMDAGFYACTWLATGLSWVALALAVTAAFKIGKMQQTQTPNVQDHKKRVDDKEGAEK